MVLKVIRLLMLQNRNSHKKKEFLNFANVSRYPASRVSFDLPRKNGKRKETVLTACTIPIEHAPNSNVTEPRAASLSKLVNHQILKFDTES